MITDPSQKRAPHRPSQPAQQPQPCVDGPLASLGRHATTVRLRQRQILTFTNGQLDSVFVVQSGLLALQAVLPGKPRQILALHYAGDVIGCARPPPLPHAALCAMAPTDLWRLPKSTFEQLLGDDPSLCMHVGGHIAKQEARALLHTAMIGGLSGEERATSFLIEQGLHSGIPSARGMSFDMHLSRNDIADYLALNADTLSRIMSRLKTRGLVAQMGRTRAVVPNWDALCAESPIADTLSALHASSQD